MRTLTRGKAGCEFTAPQPFPGHGLSACLPPGECRELRHRPPCRDGDELDTETPRSKPRRPPPGVQPVAAGSCGCTRAGLAQRIIPKRLQQENAAQRALL